MGVDLKPANGGVETFSRAFWGWRVLPVYCSIVAPHILPAQDRWQYNDGSGIDGEKAKALAEILRAEIASGRAQGFVDKRDEILAADGYGDTPFTNRDYGFTVETIRDFADWLDQCGGFEIY